MFDAIMLYTCAIAVLLMGCTGKPGCSPSPSSSPSTSTEEGDFQLVIFKKDWFSLKMGYTYDTAYPALKSATKADVLFTVGVDQIDSYDWKLQAISLTSDATDDLVESLRSGPGVTAEIKSMNDLKAKSGISNALERSLYIKGFLVKLNGEPVYGGIFLDATSQMDIKYPVIRAGTADGKAFMNILPIHIPFMARDPAPDGKPSMDGVVTKEAIGDWKQFPQDLKKGYYEKLATSKNTEEFRALIRNQEIRGIMEKAGKLK